MKFTSFFNFNVALCFGSLSRKLLQKFILFFSESSIIFNLVFAYKLLVNREQYLIFCMQSLMSPITLWNGRGISCQLSESSRSHSWKASALHIKGRAYSLVWTFIPFISVSLVSPTLSWKYDIRESFAIRKHEYFSYSFLIQIWLFLNHL